LNQDHVFLTGAGSGLGRLLALELGKMGCRLSISDVNIKGLEETKQMLVNKGIPETQICIFKCDVSNIADVKAAGVKARAQNGPVTLLINNAGIVSGKSTLENTDAMIQKTFEVNAISHLWTIREFMPDMIASKKGHIVNIASMAGMAGTPMLTDYTGSKFGAVGVSDSLRTELLNNGLSSYIKTTCICPFFINTGMFDGVKRNMLMNVLD